MIVQEVKNCLYSLYMYLIIFQDLHLVDLEDFKYGGSNITAVRLIDPERPEVKKVMEDLISEGRRFHPNRHVTDIELTMGVSIIILMFF